MTYQLVYPMAFYVTCIWLLALLNFRTRKGEVMSGNIPAKYFKTFSGAEIPEHVVVLGRHYDNQFQVPILFLVVCCAHMIVGKADVFTVMLAWVFIATRGVHSYIHLGKNQLRKRVAAFAAGWMINMLLWGQLVYFALQT